MEEDIRKQGILYLQQQQTFGKKWKRMWSVLFRENTCSISRLEFFECKDGGAMDKGPRKQQEHRKVIRLSNCIRVSEVDVNGCPKDTGSFLVETTEKMYVFAADRNQVGDWIHKLCEIAFPMNWTEPGVKRGSLQRGHGLNKEEGMEDNLLYSRRKSVCATVHDFRVFVRRTEASDRCRLTGDSVLRAESDALQLLDKTGEVVFMWPYKYLRRFGRDKTSFSFEAGRRCDSGEGSFEFETSEGNVLFQVVETAINLQRTTTPQRQPSCGGQDVPSKQNPPHLPLSTLPFQNRPPPPPQASAPQAEDCVYSTVSEHSHHSKSHHKDKESSPTSQQLQRHQLCYLEPPVDKVLTGVKSLNLDSRDLPVPQKNQVKMISSCPLPHSDTSPVSTSLKNYHHPNTDMLYSQISQSSTKCKGAKRKKREKGSSRPPSSNAAESEYSLPFDNIDKNAMADVLSGHQCPIVTSESGADPLYDSIDEMMIRNVFPSANESAGMLYGKVDHIYDEPEGCAAAPKGQNPLTAASVYDDPEEMKRDAWLTMGAAGDPTGHEYPYDPQLNDYAVPKKVQRAFPVISVKEEEEKQDSPYKNVSVKKV